MHCRMHFKRIFSLMVYILFLNCNQSPIETQSIDPSFSYVFKGTALHKDSITITLTIKNKTRLALPRFFFDNPIYTSDIPAIRDLIVYDKYGNSIDTTCTTEQIGPLLNSIIDLPENIDYPLTLQYKINPDAHHPGNYIPPTYISDSSLFLIGANIFIIPYRDEPLVQTWRKQQNINLEFQTPSINLYGIPSSNFSCKTIYELLFLQLTATRDPNPLFTGNGGGLQFNFVNITAQSYPNNQLITLSTYFTEILNEIAMSFGKLKTEKYTVVFNNILGGLEGTYGFSINHEPDLSPKSKYNYTLVHEVLHDVIGIHCGDYDDPWWKEAAATYHGATIATRIGLLDIDTLRAMLTKRVWFADSIKFNYALSDQWLRGNMFPQDIFPIAYDKGSQVLMLLDLRIRLASENKYSLDDVTNYLINHFYNAAFSRNDFLNTIRLLGNANVEDIFSTFIDKAGVTFADSTLEQTFNQLQILGAFGQSNNLNKKM